MKNFIFYFVLATGVFSVISGFGQTKFHKAYGSPEYDFAYRVIVDQAGDYVAIGVSVINSAIKDTDIVVVKTNALGNIIWSKNFGGDLLDVARDIRNTADGGYIICGRTQTSPGPQKEDAFLLKLDVNGNTQWFKTYGSGGGNDRANCVRLANGGGYIFSGGYGAWAWVVKTDINGVALFSKVYENVGFMGASFAFSIEMRSSGYIFTGTYDNTLEYKVLLTSIDESGNINWVKFIENTSTPMIGTGDKGLYISNTADGGFVVGGWSDYSFMMQNYEILLLKFDQFNTLQWQKTYGGGTTAAGTEAIEKVFQTSDGGYMLCGQFTASSFSFGGTDGAATKLDQSGNVVWSKLYGDVCGDVIYSGEETSDKGFVFGGYTNTHLSTDIYLVKTDSLGDAGLPCREKSISPVVTVPNLIVSDTSLIALDLGSVVTPTITSNAPSISTYSFCCQDPPVDIVAVKDSICLGDSSTISIVGSLCDAVLWKWAWYEGSIGAGSFISNNQNIIVSPTVTTTYYARAESSCKITLYDSITIYVSTFPTGLSANHVVCENDSVVFTSGIADYYQWSGPNGYSGLLQEFTLYNVSSVNAGLYTATLTNAPGCTLVLTSTLTVNSLPIVTLNSNSPLCVGDTLYLLSGGGLNYNWNGPSGFISSVQNPFKANISINDTGYYSVKITDSNGCENTDSVHILINSVPTVSVGNNSPLCIGDTLFLNVIGNGAMQHQWSGPNGFVSFAADTFISSVTPANAGVYTLTVSNINCSGIADTTVVVNQVSASVTGNNSYCAGQAINVSAVGGSNYNWSTGETTSSILITGTTATTYSLIVSSSGCSDTAIFTTSVNALPVFDAGPDSVICANEFLQLELSPANGSFLWSPSIGLSCVNCYNPEINLSQSQEYIIAYTDLNGCSASDTIAVLIDESCEGFYIPNAFSPNSDGENDIFFPRVGNFDKNTFTLYIYDRWGNLLFETSDPSLGWDGSTKEGKPAQQAVYLWKIDFLDKKGSENALTGNVSLLR